MQWATPLQSRYFQGSQGGGTLSENQFQEAALISSLSRIMSDHKARILPRAYQLEVSMVFLPAINTR